MNNKKIKNKTDRTSVALTYFTRSICIKEYDGSGEFQVRSVEEG